MALEANDFGVAGFAKDDDLGFRVGGIGVANAFLKLKNDGTGGIDDLKSVVTRDAIGGWRFAVRAEENPSGAECPEIVVIDGFQPKAGETCDLFAVVDDVAEAEEGPVLELGFGGFDSTRNAKTEAAIFVD